MSGYISEFFGYRAEDSSVTALDNTSKQYALFFPHTARRLSETRLIVLYLVYAL